MLRSCNPSFKLVLYSSHLAPTGPSSIEVDGTFEECLQWIEKNLWMPSASRRALAVAHPGGWEIKKYFKPVDMNAGMDEPGHIAYKTPDDRM